MADNDGGGIVRRPDILVHYSLTLDGLDRVDQLTRQLDISLTTLRVHNPALDVIVFVHGAVPDPIRSVVDRHHAELRAQPRYLDAIVETLGPLGLAFASYPPLQKWMNFETLAARAPRHSLYLDCDTVVLGRIAELVTRHAGSAVVAREEVASSRCPHGPDPAYLDEQTLADAVPTATAAFNTGVVLLNDFPWSDASTFQTGLLVNALRFALWMAEHPAPATPIEFGEVLDLEPLRAALGASDGDRLRTLALTYPSVNRWIVEEVAAWVTAGRAGLDLGSFDRRDVAQAGEPMSGSLPRTIWHYFSANQQGMEDRLGLRDPHALATCC